jgi:hypothetical protein
MSKAKESVERQPPAVFETVDAAICGSNGDARPLWVVKCGKDARYVRASTENQARQSMLELVAVPKRITQKDINDLLLVKYRESWERENADRVAVGVDDD